MIYVLMYVLCVIGVASILSTYDLGNLALVGVALAWPIVLLVLGMLTIVYAIAREVGFEAAAEAATSAVVNFLRELR